jgi:hypothetical protein
MHSAPLTWGGVVFDLILQLVLVPHALAVGDQGLGVLASAEEGYLSTGLCSHKAVQSSEKLSKREQLVKKH